MHWKDVGFFTTSIVCYVFQFVLTTVRRVRLLESVPPATRATL